MALRRMPVPHLQGVGLALCDLWRLALRGSPPRLPRLTERRGGGGGRGGSEVAGEGLPLRLQMMMTMMLLMMPHASSPPPPRPAPNTAPPARVVICQLSGCLAVAGGAGCGRAGAPHGAGGAALDARPADPSVARARGAPAAVVGLRRVGEERGRGAAGRAEEAAGRGAVQGREAAQVRWWPPPPSQPPTPKTGRGGGGRGVEWRCDGVGRTVGGGGGVITGSAPRPSCGAW